MLGTHSALFARASNQYAYVTDAAQVNLDLTGDNTIEWWAKYTSLPGNGERWIPVSKSNSGAAQIGYIPWNQRQDAGVMRAYHIISDDGANSHDVYDYTHPRAGFWLHHAVAIDVSEAIGVAQFMAYLNGVLRTYATPNNDDSATSIFNCSAQFEIGGLSSAGSNYAFNGRIADVRVWDHVRTQAQIVANMRDYVDPASSGLLANYTLNNTWADATGNNPDLTPANGASFDADPAGFTAFDGSILQLTAPDSTAPVISGVTPTSGGALAADYKTARRTPVQFDVTDLAPGLGAVLVTVKYESQSQTIVAYDGTNFLPPFVNAYSSKTAITNGFRFVLLPNGGWPRGIEEMFVYAIDSAGNVEALPA